MSIALDLVDRSHPSSNTLASELIAASGALSSDKIIIADAEQLDLLITLIRRGFTDVACQSPAFGPHAPPAGTDVLIAPHVATETELHRLLRRFGPALRPRGVLALRAADPRGFCSERRLRQILFDAGFAAIERMSSRGAVGPLWCSHKRAASLAHVA